MCIRDSCYAAMKYLGDSLTSALVDETDTSIVIIPKGDPTVLHPDFKNQPLIEFLKKQKKSIIINANNWEEDALGSGWSWNDYNESYMNERSPVSYTHLRAHETVLDLVCRLLLEKKTSYIKTSLFCKPKQTNK